MRGGNEVFAAAQGRDECGFNRHLMNLSGTFHYALLALWRAGSSFVERELVAIRTLGLPVRRSQSMVNWHVGWHMKVIMGLAILISFLALSIFLTAFLLAAR